MAGTTSHIQGERLYLESTPSGSTSPKRIVKLYTRVVQQAHGLRYSTIDSPWRFDTTARAPSILSATSACTSILNDRSMAFTMALRYEHVINLILCVDRHAPSTRSNNAFTMVIQNGGTSRNKLYHHGASIEAHAIQQHGKHRVRSSRKASTLFGFSPWHFHHGDTTAPP